jgi:predicted transcriptional regulator
MKLSEALRRTMFEFSLYGTELARESGVNKQQIYEFRSGKRDLTASNVDKIIEALPPEAKLFFLKMVGDIQAL